MSGELKNIVCFVLITLFSNICYGGEWQWEKQNNKNFVSWVECDDIFMQSFCDGWMACPEIENKISMILNYEESIGLYGESNKITSEILAWRRESYWGSAFKYVWFVRIKTRNGEILDGYLQPGMLVKTRPKIHKKDIGGFVKKESIIEKFKNILP